MRLDINDEQLKSIVSEAIFASLTEEARGTMIKGALAHLLTPEKTGNYGAVGLTPIQQAFNRAIETVANVVVREELAKNEAVRDAINAMTTEAIRAFMGAEKDKMVQRMAGAIARAITDDRR